MKTKTTEILLVVVILLALAFVCSCDESPAEATTATLGKDGRYYSPTGHGMPRGYSPGVKMYACSLCLESFELPEELEEHKVCTRDFWGEKDENGISNAEHMAKSRRIHEKRAAERKRQAEEAAIEREAEIQSRAALKLIKMLKLEMIIPTWPDYIELERDLYLGDSQFADSEYYVIKGSKIYFKDD